MSSKSIDIQPKKSGSYLMTALGFIFIFLITALILATCTETGRKYADNFKDKIFSNGQKLKDLDVLMFMSPSCQHCVKTIGVLKKEKEINNLTLIDVTLDEGKKIAEKFGADKRPVPSFISIKTHRSAIGSIESVSQLVKALSPVSNSSESSKDSSEKQGGGEAQNGNIDMDLIQKLDIILFAMEGCGHCVKAKEECDKAGISNSIKIVNVSTPEGQKIASELLPKDSHGFPAWMSMSTKKHVIGYKSIDQIIKDLQGDQTSQ